MEAFTFELRVDLAAAVATGSASSTAVQLPPFAGGSACQLLRCSPSGVPSDASNLPLLLLNSPSMWTNLCAETALRDAAKQILFFIAKGLIRLRMICSSISVVILASLPVPFQAAAELHSRCAARLLAMVWGCEPPRRHLLHRRVATKSAQKFRSACCWWRRAIRATMSACRPAAGLQPGLEPGALQVSGHPVLAHAHTSVIYEDAKWYDFADDHRAVSEATDTVDPYYLSYRMSQYFYNVSAGRQCIHAIFGPTIDYSVTQLMPFAFHTGRIPMLTVGALDEAFADKSETTLVRLTPLQTRDIVDIIGVFMRSNGWRRVTVIYQRPQRLPASDIPASLSVGKSIAAWCTGRQLKLDGVECVFELA
uniref:ANF_receptor domain-containing protein n=1 Tax=Macrostomum lignano TaxID=282301 RepID=A0A1I8FNK8_9PLAT